MAPDPRCTALAAAMKKKGMSYGQIAEKVNKPEQHVIDVCTGTVSPSHEEFDALARVLDITAAPPHDAAHVTK